MHFFHGLSIGLLFFVNLIYCHDASVEESFKNAKIVPDVLSTYPSHKVKIVYSSSGKTVSLGNEIAPIDVKNQPNVNYNGEPEKFYTLIMTDPDAPSKQEPTEREFQHWLVGNIPGNDLSSGEVLTEYVGAGPPLDSGLHRYVFIVYEHNQRKEFTEPIIKNTNGIARKFFKTEAFAAKYDLGKPCAGNYFLAEYDDSVPAIHEQLGFT